MAFIENLSNFISAGTPGYAVATIGATAVEGIFDSVYAETLGMIGGYVPVFICASANVSSVTEGQAMIISAINFKVAGVEHDHILKTGLATLRLEKV